MMRLLIIALLVLTPAASAQQQRAEEIMRCTDSICIVDRAAMDVLMVHVVRLRAEVAKCRGAK